MNIMQDKVRSRFFIFIGVIVLFLTGAHYLRTQKQLKEQKDAKIYCTTYPIYLFTKAITAHTIGPQAELLLPANTGCPHDYAITPTDLMKLSGNKVLLLTNGLGLDDAIAKAALRANPSLIVADTTAGFRPIVSGKQSCSHKEKGCKHDHDHGNGANPHMFASPDMASGMVENITAVIEKLSPANKEKYRKNAASLIFALKNLEKEIKETDFKQKNIAVQHDVFAYLARLAGLNQAVTLDAETAKAPSPARVAELKKQIKDQKIAVIFSEPQYPADLPKLLAKECGIKHAVLDPVASGPADADASYYVKTMRNNLAVLKEHLCK